MVKIYPANDTSIDRLANLLKQGELVAFPTETVYGLGADATNAAAVQAVYALKNRPNFNPLISHYADLLRLKQDVVWSLLAEEIAQKFWPGPLTMVLPKKDNSTLCDEATASLETAAVRMPAHPLAKRLLAAFAGPVVAPSANPSGYLSPVAADHVMRGFEGKPLAILDGGRTPQGIESTVIRLLDDQIYLLREGTISREQLETSLRRQIMTSSVESKQPSSPGQLLKHYSPKKPLRLSCDNPKPKEALIGFGCDMEKLYPGFSHYESLSISGNLEEAASNLFHILHQLDQQMDIHAIAVAPIPKKAIGRAIHDRLKRASAQN